MHSFTTAMQEVQGERVLRNDIGLWSDVDLALHTPLISTGFVRLRMVDGGTHCVVRLGEM